MTLLLLAAAPAQAATETAYFAGGCFWCMEADFEKLPGVESVVSGYMGGEAKANYEEVSAGHTGHAESVQIRFDPTKTSYMALLDHYWKNVDPTVKDRQFCDAGSQYRAAIFYANPDQKRLADESRAQIEKSGRFKKIYTQITAAGTFYPAEDYHQDYYKKNPIRYQWYRSGCGRDQRLKDVWGGK